MADNKIKGRLIPYGATTALWAFTNPVVAQGELVYEILTDNSVKFKAGNGIDNYEDLSFIDGSASSTALQTVLNFGNVAQNIGGGTAQIQLLNADGSQQVFMDGNGTEIKIGSVASTGKWIQISAGTLIFMVNNVPIMALNGGLGLIQPYVFFKDQTSAHTWQMNCVALTANRNQQIQDKDGVIALLSDIAAAGTLQGVLNAGNTASDSSGGVSNFSLNGTFSSGTGTLICSGKEVTLQIGGTEVISMQSGASGGQPFFYLKDATTSHKTIIQQVPLTADRTLSLYAYRNGEFALAGNGLAPTMTPHASGAGTGATITIDTGSDDSGGSLTLVTGTGMTTNDIIDVTFNSPYPNANFKVILSSFLNISAASQIGAYIFPSSRSVNGFTIASLSGLSSGATYLFYWNTSK